MATKIYATMTAEQGSPDLELALGRGWEPYAISMAVVPGKLSIGGGTTIAVRCFVGVRKLYDPDAGPLDAVDDADMLSKDDESTT